MSMKIRRTEHGGNDKKGTAGGKNNDNNIEGEKKAKLRQRNSQGEKGE